MSLACDQRHNKHGHIKIHEYKVHNTLSSDEWLYWYFIYGNNTSYSYSSPTKVSDFSGVRFTSSSVSIAEIKEVAVEEEVLEEPLAEIAEDLPTELTEEGGIPESELEDPSGNEDTNSSPSESDSTSDSSSGDTSSGDSGGDSSD